MNDLYEDLTPGRRRAVTYALRAFAAVLFMRDVPIAGPAVPDRAAASTA